MSYQVTLNSRNVLVPITLERQDGERLDLLPSRLDTATAMVITVTDNGAIAQEFIPLSIHSGSAKAYEGREWELRAHRAGTDHSVFYLGIPDIFFASSSIVQQSTTHPASHRIAANPPSSGSQLKSISIQVVGASPLSTHGDFSGGVDIALQAQVELPLIPGFIGLAERFFPTLLPNSSIERHAVDIFDFQGVSHLVLMASLRPPSAEPLPVSFGKHWDPKNWLGAVVENLEPGSGRYHVIKGGCFYGRHRGSGSSPVTHWFGSGIGLEEKSFRHAAAERIRGLGPSGNGAWVFWLEPQGLDGEGQAALLSPHPLQGGAGAEPVSPAFSVRHPMMHRFLFHRSEAKGRNSDRNRAGTQRPGAGLFPEERLPAESVIPALRQVAALLVEQGMALQRARSEPSPAFWSEEALDPAGALAMAGSLSGWNTGIPPAGDQALDPLRASIHGLYRVHGDALRRLESLFDETTGYILRDELANPVRDTLDTYLTEVAAASSPAET